MFPGPHPLPDTEAESLVVRARNGDTAALKQLFDAWFPKLVTLAYHYVRSVDVANDIAQDAFIVFWENRSRWEWTGSTFGYLQLIVRRASLNAIRKHVTEERHHSALAAQGHAPALGVSSNTDASNNETELWQLVAEVVQRLPPRTRAVALMRWFEGLGRQETADALGVSIRTVDAQLFTAATVVRKAIQNRTR